MQDLTTPLRELVDTLGLELYDVEFASGSLNVTVDKSGGIDSDTLAKANQAISAWLDETDPIAGRFTLDVSSPGLERKLRTAAHFRGAVGSRVTLRERRGSEPTRRLEGVITAADEHAVTLDDAQLGTVVIALDAIERARTIFVWGAQPKPSPSRGNAKTNSKGSK